MSIFIGFAFAGASRVDSKGAGATSGGGSTRDSGALGFEGSSAGGRCVAAGAHAASKKKTRVIRIADLHQIGEKNAAAVAFSGH